VRGNSALSICQKWQFCFLENRWQNIWGIYTFPCTLENSRGRRIKVGLAVRRSARECRTTFVQGPWAQSQKQGSPPASLLHHWWCLLTVHINLGTTLPSQKHLRHGDCSCFQWRLWSEQLIQVQLIMFAEATELEYVSSSDRKCLGRLCAKQSCTQLSVFTTCLFFPFRHGK
jgi:hypothetical protein